MASTRTCGRGDFYRAATRIGVLGSDQRTRFAAALLVRSIDRKVVGGPIRQVTRARTVRKERQIRELRQVPAIRAVAGRK